MAQIGNIIGLFERLSGRDIAVRQDLCVSVRNRNVGCRRCAEVCALGAVSIGDNQLSLDAQACIGCGVCCTVCPTGALAPLRPSDTDVLEESLAALQAANGEVVIADARMLSRAQGLYDPARVVAVGNIGRVDEALLVAVAQAGATRITLVLPPGEEGAPMVDEGAAVAQEVCSTANALLEAWGSPCRTRVSDKFPPAARRQEAAAFDEERRSFFSSMRHEAKETAGIAAGMVVDEALGANDDAPTVYESLRVVNGGTLPQAVPPRRTLLLHALSALGEPADVDLPTRLWGHVDIDVDTCTSCRMCAMFCPTGALSLYTDDEEGTTGIEHAPGTCVKCGTCERVCFPGALHLHDSVLASDVLAGAVVRYEMIAQEQLARHRNSFL